MRPNRSAENLTHRTTLGERLPRQKASEPSGGPSPRTPLPPLSERDLFRGYGADVIDDDDGADTLTARTSCRQCGGRVYYLASRWAYVHAIPGQDHSPVIGDPRP